VDFFSSHFTKCRQPSKSKVRVRHRIPLTPRAAKALAAKKAVVKGVQGKAVRKIRTSATFRLPKTLKLQRQPKYPRKSIPALPRMDEFSVLKFPLNTESAMRKIEAHNTLVFICDVRANKQHIADAVKRMYGVDALRVNTLIRYASRLWRRGTDGQTGWQQEGLRPIAR
jgi:large subunit ribosomal protein L23Ae